LIGKRNILTQNLVDYASQRPYVDGRSISRALFGLNETIYFWCQKSWCPNLGVKSGKVMLDTFGDAEIADLHPPIGRRRNDKDVPAKSSDLAITLRQEGEERANCGL
jgi:hypothetical protein